MNFSLDHAPKGTSRFARWESDEAPFIGSFSNTPLKAVTDEAEEEEDGDEMKPGALGFVTALNAGDTLYSEMGGSSDNICAAAAARGVTVLRIPTFELKNARVSMGLLPEDTVRVLWKLSNDEPGKFYSLRPTDAAILKLRVYTRGYRMVQKDVRIKTQLRLMALLRDSRLVQGLPEATRDEQKEFLIGNPIFKGAAEYEEQLKREVGKNLKGIPVASIFEGVKGIGPLIAAGIIAEMGDIRRFRSVASLKAYAGWHLTPGGTKPVRGQDHWNANLHQFIYLAIASFEKQKGSSWQEVLATRKAYEKSQHPEKIKDDQGKTRFNPGHLRNRAYRYTAQQLLEWIWREWAKLEGIEIDGDRLAA